MYRISPFDLSAWRCKKMLFPLACAWFIGLISGVLFSMSASGAFVSTLRTAPSSCVSFFGLLSAILLPLLSSAAAVYFSTPVLLFPTVFMKAFLVAWLGLGILAAFGSAGWLIRMLLMFSEILSLPLLWWYWQRILSGQRDRGLCTLIALLFALGIGCADYYLIAPFLVDLLS